MLVVWCVFVNVFVCVWCVCGVWCGVRVCMYVVCVCVCVCVFCVVCLWCFLFLFF